jgi:two-component system response regulator DevR
VSEGWEAIRVIVVDDHVMVAEMIQRVLQEAPGISVVGIAGSVNEGIDLIVKRRPDVALIDYRLPDGDGVQIGKAIAEQCPSVKAIMLTGVGGKEVFVAAIEVGFVGFLLKNAATFQLVEAVRRVHSGGVHLPPDLLPEILPRIKKGYHGRGSDLTRREIEVLTLLASGLGIDQIASTLVLSRNTVRNHVQNILTKLRAHSQLEAVSIALKEHIVQSV